MASVGAGSAYAVRVQVSFSTLTHQDCRRTSSRSNVFSIVRPRRLGVGNPSNEPALRSDYTSRPMDARNEHAADRLQHWWHLPTLPCRAAIHDLAGEPCLVRPFQHPPLKTHGRLGSAWRHLARASTLLPLSSFHVLALKDPQFFAYVCAGYFVWNFVPVRHCAARSAFLDVSHSYNRRTYSLRCLVSPG